MNMNDLKSGEPFFDEWYIDSYIDKTPSGSALKIYRELDGLREFNIMKVIQIPRDKHDKCPPYEQTEDGEAQYYKELVTDVYRTILLLEKLPDRQHIVSYEDHLIYELGDQPGYEILLRMEYLDKFRESIKTEPLTYQDVILLGKNICDALDVYERYHIIHGDINPDCIYLSEHGQYKLGGFPFVETDQHNDPEKITASLSFTDYSDYTAPEIIAGQSYDKRADIYSLGLVMYTCLNNDELPLDERNMPLPANGFKELGQVVLKACEFLPEDRYQSAKEFQEALIAVSIFLGEVLTERINSNDMEEAEIYVAATSENKSECVDILQREQAHQQLQEELMQKLQSELAKEPIKQNLNPELERDPNTESKQKAESDLKKNIKPKSGQSSKSSRKQKEKGRKAGSKSDSMKDKDEPRVSLVSLKKTRNMGPWVLAIWTSVLTIAVLIILIKGDFIISNDEDSVENISPSIIVQPTIVVTEDNREDPSITVPIENLQPTIEVIPDDLEPEPEIETVTLLHSGEKLESFDQIESLNEAEIMDFSDNSIKDLSALSESSKVETLKLNDNAINDVRPLKKLVTLKELDLSDNKIITVVSLKNLLNLEVLSLSNNQLPNALGIEKLTNLKMLYLDGNDIADVSKLSSLKKLVFLDLSNNRVSEEDIIKLQNALPNCIINY